MRNSPSTIDDGALLDAFGHGQLRYAVAYGSGAMKQESYGKNDTPMLDLILAVDDPVRWHAKNLAVRPQDYSLLSLLGPHVVADVQEWGAGMYYNPHVRFGKQEIKYGVTSTRRLLDDLLHWRDLYSAGRLQKPVRTLKDDPEVADAKQTNLAAAVSAARLLLPETFTERDLYATITGLSYGGDVRMGVGEHPKKISNIVSGSLPAFRALYDDALASSPELAARGEGYVQDRRPDIRQQLVRRLPPDVAANPGLHPDEDIAVQQEALRAQLAAIVSGSSLVMTMKGILTAGPLKSLKYVAAKLGKRWQSS